MEAHTWSSLNCKLVPVHCRGYECWYDLFRPTWRLFCSVPHQLHYKLSLCDNPYNCCNVSHLKFCHDFSHVTQDMERVCITIEGGLILHGDVLVISFFAWTFSLGFFGAFDDQCLECAVPAFIKIHWNITEFKFEFQFSFEFFGVQTSRL